MEAFWLPQLAKIMSFSLVSMVSSLSQPIVRSTSIPRFATGASVHRSGWKDWTDSQPGETLRDVLNSRFSPSTKVSNAKGTGLPRPKVIILGEQHHQPKVIAAQLKLLHTIALEPFNIRITVVMEHFNILQQMLLDNFALNGEAKTLQDECAKSSEGFRIDNTGYLPLLNLIRELENVASTVKAGFPPREWARVIMRQGKEGLVKQNEQALSSGGVLQGFDRWEDINVSPEHAAYIASSISGDKPELPAELSQSGLKTAQAFKDTIMAWTIDNEVKAAEARQVAGGESPEEIIVAICGSGHCEYDFGVTERIRSCSRDEILLLVCKSDDGAYWTNADGEATANTGRLLADGIITYEAIDV